MKNDLTKKIAIVTILILLQLLYPVFSMAQIEFSTDLQNVPSSIRTVQDLAAWFAKEFTYRWEVPDKWQSPQETIDSKEGDCEDFAVLASSILTELGIENEIVLIKFQGLQIGHALCVWKDQNGIYNFISSQDLCRTGKSDLQEAIEKYYPDWHKIIFSDINNHYLKIVTRKK